MFRRIAVFALKTIVCALLIAWVTSMASFETSCQKLENDVLRVHIIPHSDSAADQSLKANVREAVLDYFSPLIAPTASKKEAEAVVRAHLDTARARAQAVVRENGYYYPVSVKLENSRFSTRYYQDFTMPAGRYDALKVEIGDAKGSNFWCVMYPGLCVGAASSSEMEKLDEDEVRVIKSEDIEFRFLTLEYIQKIRAFFSDR